MRVTHRECALKAGIPEFFTMHMTNILPVIVMDARGSHGC